MKIADSGPCIIERNRELAPLTTMGIGGRAAYFAEPASIEQLVEAIEWARGYGRRFFLLGSGSNLVFDDRGFDGLVIRPALSGIHVLRDQGTHVLLEVAAGESWDGLVAHSVARNWGGLECLSGIPGTVGAAPIQNIGAYGQELSETVTGVRLLDLERLEPVFMEREQCGFAYRDSIFKGEARGRFAVTALRLKLTKNAAAVIRYPDLEKQLPEDATLGRVRETVLAVRSRKSMIVDAADPNARSCGSFFVNPILSKTAYEAFLQREPGAHPHFPAGSGRIKLAAAWLIEQAGFHKGFIQGRVGLSQKHSLALINRGGGTCREIQALVKTIQEGVRRRFEISLVPEPQFVPYGPA